MTTTAKTQTNSYDPSADPEYATVLRESDVTEETMREVFMEHAAMRYAGETYGMSAHDTGVEDGVPVCYTCRTDNW